MLYFSHGKLHSPGSPRRLSKGLSERVRFTISISRSAAEFSCDCVGVESMVEMTLWAIACICGLVCVIDRVLRLRRNAHWRKYAVMTAYLPVLASGILEKGVRGTTTRTLPY